MSRKVVQTFLAIGGPLHGYKVTEQYAGTDYVRFMSSVGEFHEVIRKTSPSGRTYTTYGDVICPKNLLIHVPSLKEFL